MGERLPEAAGSGYRARHVETAQEVHLRTHVSDGSSGRASLREKLRAIDCAQLLRLLEVHVNEVEEVEVWGAGAMDLCAARPSWPRWPPRRVNRRPPRRPRLRSRVCGKRSRVPRCFRWVGDLACGSHRPPCLWGSATRPPDRQAGTPAATPTRGTQCPPTRNCRGTRA